MHDKMAVKYVFKTISQVRSSSPAESSTDTLLFDYLERKLESYLGYMAFQPTPGLLKATDFFGNRKLNHDTAGTAFATSARFHYFNLAVYTQTKFSCRLACVVQLRLAKLKDHEAKQ